MRWSRLAIPDILQAEVQVVHQTHLAAQLAAIPGWPSRQREDSMIAVQACKAYPSLPVLAALAAAAAIGLNAGLIRQLGTR